MTHNQDAMAATTVATGRASVARVARVARLEARLCSPAPVSAVPHLPWRPDAHWWPAAGGHRRYTAATASFRQAMMATPSGGGSGSESGGIGSGGVSNTSSADTGTLKRGLLVLLRARQSTLDEAVGVYSELRRRSSAPLPLALYNEILNRCAAERRVDVAEIVFEHMLDANVRPDESTFVALIRAAVVARNLELGFGLIEDMLDVGIRARLRTYAPLLEAATSAESPDVALSLRVWEHMRGHGVAPREEQVIGMLSVLLRPGALDAHPTAAAGLLATVDELFCDLARVATEVTPAGALQLQTAMHGAPVPVPAPGPQAATASASAVAVHVSSAGTCPHCRHELRVLGLSNGERESMRAALLEQAAATDIDQRHDLAEFAEWLKHRPPFTVAIDAANVAYCRQNYGGGRFSFEQINTVLDTLREQGENPLVVIPRKYLKENIPNHSADQYMRRDGKRVRQQPVSAADNKLRQRWLDEDVMFTPRFSWADDDWYWMYFTVAYPSGGKPVYVVTNDETRDHHHHLDLLEPRAFQRWRATHIKNFDFPRCSALSPSPFPLPRPIGRRSPRPTANHTSQRPQWRRRGSGRSDDLPTAPLLE